LLVIFKINRIIVKMKKLILLFIILCTPLLSAGTWSSGDKLVRAVMWKPGVHGFYVDKSVFQDPNGCGDNTGLYLVDGTLSEKEVDRLYSMILSAFSTGKKLHVWLEGCQGKFPTFTGLQINQ